MQTPPPSSTENQTSVLTDKDQDFSFHPRSDFGVL